MPRMIMAGQIGRPGLKKLAWGSLHDFAVLHIPKCSESRHAIIGALLRQLCRCLHGLCIAAWTGHLIPL